MGLPGQLQAFAETIFAQLHTSECWQEKPSKCLQSQTVQLGLTLSSLCMIERVLLLYHSLEVLGPRLQVSQRADGPASGQALWTGIGPRQIGPLDNLDAANCIYPIQIYINKVLGKLCQLVLDIFCQQFGNIYLLNLYIGI